MSTASKDPHSSSPTRLKNLSPEKYGRTAFRELSYTPEKLTENFLYKEITVTKKIEVEKKRIRELESETAVQAEKIRQLEIEIDTVRKSLTLQIEMYKKMLKDKDQEHAKLIKSQQTSYNLEIHKLLEEHEQDSKVAQAEKEELEARIAELLRKIEELEYQLHHGNNANQELTQNLELTTQNLKNTQEKLSRTQELARINQERSSSEINSLNKQLDKQREAFRQQLENVLAEKAREIDGIRKLHQTELDKLENKRAAEMSAKNLELKELAKTFESEGRRLDEIISHKDRVNSSLTADLNKEKDTVAALTHQYETEISGLLQTKEMLLGDLDRLSKERNALVNNCQTLEHQLGKNLNHSEMVITGLKDEISLKNADLLRENDRLNRTVQAYESQLGFLKGQQMQLQHQKHIDTNRIRMTSEQLAEENRLLLVEIKNLKEVLMESSMEMERCKEEFLRLDREKERLIRINHDCETESMRLKALLADRDMEARQWRDTYVALKARY